MAEKRQSQTRRVSFAAEPQVQYITASNYDNSKTSSSGHESQMDLTTEVPEFKSMLLFQRTTLPEETLDELFGNDVLGEIQDDSMEASEYVRRLSISAKRNSLETIKVNAASAALAKSEDAKENVHTEISNTAMQEENDIVRKSLGSDPNGTAITNSSYVVEELINTADLRAILPQERQKLQNLDEYFTSVGIRFLDDAIIDGLRRDTLSKSRNVVDKSLIYYYRYSLKERIEYLQSFSSFLDEKMQDLQRCIVEAQNTVDLENVNKENLKKIRNESRNKARVDWYTLRRINELQFNKKIICNKLTLGEEYEKRKKECECNASIIARKESHIREMSEKIEAASKRLSQGQPGRIQEAVKLQQMINDRAALLLAVKEEHGSILHKIKNQEDQISLVDSQIIRLREEIERLKMNFINRNVTEGMLEEAKNAVRRYSLLFDFKIDKITGNMLILRISGCKATFIFDNKLVLTNCSIDVPEPDSIFKIVSSAIPEGRNLRSGAQLVVGRFMAARTLKKQLDGLKERYKMESFILNGILHLRLYVLPSILVLDLLIDGNYDIYRNKELLANLLADPLFLPRYILQCQEAYLKDGNELK